MSGKILDQFGRPIERPPKTPERHERFSASIRDRYSDYPSHGLTPVRLAAIFREADGGDARRQAQLFEEMEEKDGHLLSQLQTRKLAVAGLDYELEPADDSAKAAEIADFCRDQLGRLPAWDENVVDLLDCIGKGYSAAEIIWDVSGGQAALADLRWIHPARIVFVDSLTPKITTATETRGVEPPPFKLVYHRYKARSGYDTRAGILRVCGWMYLFKNYGIKDWVAFAEVFGMPLRIGKYEPGADSSDKDALINAIRSLGSDAAGIISKATEIEFVEVATKAASVDVFERLADFCDRQNSKAILGQVLTSDGGAGGRGSYALGKVHADVREDLVKSDCRALDRVARAQLLRPLVAFNYGWDAAARLLPTYRTLYQEPEDQLAQAQTYEILIRSGLDVSQEHLSDRFNIPLRAKGETPLAKENSELEMANGELRKKIDSKMDAPGGRSSIRHSQFDIRNSLRTAKDTPRRPDVDWAERLAEASAAAAAPAIAALAERIVAAAGGAADYQDLQRKIVELLPGIDSVELKTVIEQTLLAAELAGRLSGSE